MEKKKTTTKTNKETKTVSPKKTEKKELFANVFGYEDVKEELLRIREWLTNEQYLNNKDIMLPKAILFHGPVGTGKTLFLKEYADSFDAPVYIIDGSGEAVSSEVNSIFNKAKKNKFAIVCIDELELLIGRSSQIERVLQSQLDGIDKTGRILVLATTNHLNDISSALTRNGRFDRIIEIGNPSKESRKVMLKNFVTQLGLNDEEVDYDHVSKVCFRCSGADLKAVLNDAYLRCGKTLNTDEIEKSYDRVVRDDYSNKSVDFKDYRVAVHEAGHIAMSLAFRENFSFYLAKFNNNGGTTEVLEVDEKKDTIEKREQNIMISLAGYLSEEAILKNHEVGSWSDYCRAEDMCERLVERCCKNGIKHLVTADWIRGDKHWTDRKRLSNEKVIDASLHRYVRLTKKYVRKHKNMIKQIADIMFEKGRCSYKDVSSLVE